MSSPVSLESRLWSIGILVVAAITFPYVLTFSLAAAIWHRLRHGRRPTAPMSKKPKTAIVTGGKMTKAMVVCRQLKRAGCRVILAETEKYWMVASRFSKCVDRFVTFPLPEKDPAGFNQALKMLAYEEDADVFVPVTSPAASIFEARAATGLPASCVALGLNPVNTESLDDKVTFSELAKSCGLPVPDTRRMCSKEDVMAFNEQLLAQKENATQYILKSVFYDSMRRLDLFTLPTKCVSPATSPLL